METCVDGEWGACVVPETARACTDACGTGSQTCKEGAWSSCEVPDSVQPCATPCGAGHAKCSKGVLQACDAPQPVPPTYVAHVWDFDDSDPDFEPDAGARGGLQPGLVAPDLGPDDTPVFSAVPGASSIHSAASFAEWYRTTPGVNMEGDAPLAFAVSSPGVDTFDEESFFPIDGRLLGNQGRLHNYDFTLALMVSFTYRGGETIRIKSDDDSWLFLNRKLAIDLGGIHQGIARSVDLDQQSGALGLVKGTQYPLHLFYAERHVVSAVLRIDLPASDFDVCP
jgi:fibro-slime domain-containing protein